MESGIKQMFRGGVCRFFRGIQKGTGGFLLFFSLLSVFFAAGCGNDAPPTGAAVVQRDSLPVMVTYGVSKLISDSGVVKYKIIAEEWRVFDKTDPPRQEFPKGLFLQRFNKDFQVDLYITADTAYCYNQNLWELRGRIFVNNFANGTTFRTEELFWNMARHEIYSNKYMHIITPDRDLEGDWFRSNEAMTQYHIKQSRGFMPMPTEEEELQNASKSNENEPDIKEKDDIAPMRQRELPVSKAQYR